MGGSLWKKYYAATSMSYSGRASNGAVRAVVGVRTASVLVVDLYLLALVPPTASFLVPQIRGVTMFFAALWAMTDRAIARVEGDLIYA